MKGLPLEPDQKTNQSILEKWFSYLGPGFITAALVFGPGSLTVTSKLGASSGFRFLWVIVVSTLFMIVFTSMAVRIGVASDNSLLATIREKWGKPISVLIGLGIFGVTASFQAGNSIGAGLAFAELFKTSSVPWIVFFTLVSVSLLYFKSFYKILEKLMLILVAIMLFSFVGTLIITGPELSSIISGFVPRLPGDSLLLVVALIASSFSIVGAFYQSYLVQEKGWKRINVKEAQAEGFSGITVLGLIGATILISAATVLHSQNIEINSAADMGRAIEPLFGGFATSLFMIGLFGASFSSLIGNATIGGTLLGDSIGYGSRLSSGPIRFLIMLVMVTGATVAIVFGRLPLDLIVIAQGITIFVVPFIGIMLFLTANDEEIMGNLKNGRASNILGVLGLLILFGLAFRNINLVFN